MLIATKTKNIESNSLTLFRTCIIYDLQLFSSLFRAMTIALVGIPFSLGYTVCWSYLSTSHAIYSHVGACKLDAKVQKSTGKKRTTLSNVYLNEELYLLLMIEEQLE